MKTINLTCNHCGAPLDVPETTNFVTCRFCSTRLAIEHSASAAYTRVLEEIENRTSELSEDLGTIKLQNELERLDREWQTERERLSIRGKNGQILEPDSRVAGCTAVFLFFVGVVWMIIPLGIASISGANFIGIGSGFGLAIAIYGIVRCLTQVRLAEQFAKAKSDYESRRYALTEDLDARASKN